MRQAPCHRFAPPSPFTHAGRGSEGGQRPRLRALVEALLLRALRGRRLLPGNFVSAPVLGQQAVLWVERVDAPAAPSSSGSEGAAPGEVAGSSAAAGAHGSSLQAAPLVTLHWRVHLLGPEEEELPAADAALGGGAQQQGAAASADYAQAAAAAAAEVVGGGLACGTYVVSVLQLMLALFCGAGWLLDCAAQAGLCRRRHGGRGSRGGSASRRCRRCGQRHGVCSAGRGGRAQAGAIGACGAAAASVCAF